MSRPGVVALVLLLFAAGTALPALPAQSQDEEQAQRWPYFETEHLILPPGSAQDFGHDVDTDGQRILVAAREAAYLYERDTDLGGWLLVATLDPTGGAVRSVSLGDGHAAVGSTGTVDVWRPDGDDGAWTLRKTLAGDDPFGEDVLVRDGLLLVSAPRAQTLGDLGRGGAVHVHRLGGAYSEAQVLREPSGTVQRVFGADLDLQGNTLAVGAPARQFTEQVAPGAAYVYARSGNTFALSGSMEATRGSDADSSFGRRLATTGDMVLVSASSGAYGGDPDGSGWVSFYERSNGSWRLVQEEMSDTTAVAARDDAALTVDWWWSVVRVYQRHDYCSSWGPWCSVGVLGGWERFFSDNPFPEVLAMEGRVAALGAPRESVPDGGSGLVLAYYDNAVPVAIGLPNEPVQDTDEDGRELVTLDASHSFDRDGEIVSYAWWRGAELVSEEPFVDLDLPLGTHPFRLEVTDDLGGVGKADVRVVVQSPELVLDFSYCCSYFRSGLRPDQPVYFWSQVQDHRAGIKHWDWDFDGDGTADSTEINPSHVFPHGGDWTVTLTVTNEAGDRMTHAEVLEVRNKPPTAHAGLPQVLAVDATGVATATLDGSASSDLDGTLRSHDWMRRDPVAGTYSSTASGEEVEVTVTRGVNPFRLHVTDDAGATSQAQTTVIAINAGQNTTGLPPDVAFTARDLGDRRVLLEDRSEPGDADIVAWTWRVGDETQPGGPEHVVAFDGPGRYEVRLTVYDADGRSRGRTQTVTVDDEPPEVAMYPAGGTVPQGAHVVLRSSARDEAPDGLTWRWSVGGSDYSDHQDAGRTFDEVGNHTLSVTVTDDAGNAARADGWLEVVSEEEFRERFGEQALNATTDGNGTGPGVFEEPDEAFREELERQRDGGGDGATDRDDADGDEADDDAGPEPLAAAAPRAPDGPSLVVWSFVALAVAVAALLAVEVERQRRRRARRRERYEAAMKARLARRQQPRARR